MTDPEKTYNAILDEVRTVLIGKEDVIEQLTISLLTGGHVLLEGVPGIAKTTAATLFARATGLDASRIQMTPDLLPADITGTHVYHEPTSEFALQRGPVFANLVLADEINRATPKTQSALLESMQERQVTIQGETLSLPTPFMVIATQNPIEMEGTFELPEAQRDRFQMKVVVGLPNREEEGELLDRFDATPDLDSDAIEQVVDPADLLEAREVVTSVHVDDSIKAYIIDIVEATREHTDISHGGSPRASLAFLHASKARAAIHGREYVIPDDVKALAEPILTHRLLLTAEAELSDMTSTDVIEDVISSVEPPGSTAPDDRSSSDGPVPYNK